MGCTNGLEVALGAAGQVRLLLFLDFTIINTVKTVKIKIPTPSEARINQIMMKLVSFSLLEWGLLLYSLGRLCVVGDLVGAPISTFGSSSNRGTPRTDTLNAVKRVYSVLFLSVAKAVPH